jgi:carbonic anhydrase
MLISHSNHKFSDSVAYANVENSLEEILERSQTIKDLFSRGDIGLVGGVYDVESGEVDFFKNLTNHSGKSKN